jgi:hypothetical protein
MASLIMLCASHIDSEARMSRFRIMLKSIVHQVVNVPLFISVSTNNETFKNELLVIAKEHTEFVFFIQDCRLSQFQHYAFLAQAALSHNPETTWCIFTDDDDVSHCTRSCVFLDHIVNSPDNISVVRDTAVRTQYETKGKISGKSYHTSSEYITYACKLRVLQDYCQRASDAILSLVGCDMMFAVYMGMQPINTFHNSHWLYEYTVRREEKTGRFQAHSEYNELKQNNVINLDWLL